MVLNMLKILSIGNSFSQDAQSYLYRLAKSGGTELKTVNLMIGGCSLQTHWQNAKQDLASYEYEENGQPSGQICSIKQALQGDNWDFITLQQASHDSGLPDTYFPFLTQLSDYVKGFAPQAEQLIHQTWAYETDSTHGGFAAYQNNQQVMFDALKNAYRQAAETLGVRTIPSGQVIQSLRGTPEFDYQNGGLSLCRDGFHMSFSYGRYAVAATWYTVLTKKSLFETSFLPEDVGGIAEEKIELIKKTIHFILNTD